MHKHVCVELGRRGTTEGVSLCGCIPAQRAGITAPTVLLQLDLRGPLLMHSFQDEMLLPVATHELHPIAPRGVNYERHAVSKPPLQTSALFWAAKSSLFLHMLDRGWGETEPVHCLSNRQKMLDNNNINERGWGWGVDSTMAHNWPTKYSWSDN